MNDLNYPERQDAALQKLEDATSVVHAFANGPVDGVVHTESGKAPTLLAMIAALVGTLTQLWSTFASVDEGMAAVADGALFQVASPDAGTYMRVYRRTGDTAMQVADYPSAGFVSAIDARTSSIHDLPEGAIRYVDIDGFVSDTDVGHLLDDLPETAAKIADLAAYDGGLMMIDADGFAVSVLDDQGNLIGGSDQGSAPPPVVARPETRLDTLLRQQVSGERASVALIGHRGFYTPMNPGNTMYALARSTAFGSNILETDMQVTSDGVVVLYHDSTLDTVTNLSGKIAQHSYADIAAARFKAYEGNPVASLTGIPRAVDVLAYARRFGLLLSIEVKAYRSIADVALMVDLIRQAGMLANVIIPTNSLGDLRAVRQATADAHVSLQLQGITSEAVRSDIDQLATVKRAWVSLDKALLFADPSLVAYAHAKGVGVEAFTTDYAYETDVLRDMGVTLVCCNQPMTRH